MNEPESPQDAALIADFIEHGSERSFRALYRAHNSRIAPMVLRLTGGDTHLADDLLQEIWINACRGLAAFRRESSFSTWLHVIAIRAVHNHYRRRKIRYLEETNADALPCVAPQDGGTRIDLERALSRLPDGYRTILVLHDIEGLHHRQIAELVGVSEGTSKSQLTRARLRMRQMLQPPREGRHATR